MKKRFLIGLLALTAALVLSMAFAACDSGGSSEDSTERLIQRGTIDGKAVEAIINKSGNFKAAALEPANDQHYVIRFIDPVEVISQGTIEYSAPYITFVPNDGGARFTGLYYGGYGFSVNGIRYNETTYNLSSMDNTTQTKLAGFTLTQVDGKPGTPTAAVKVTWAGYPATEAQHKEINDAFDAGTAYVSITLRGVEQTWKWGGSADATAWVFNGDTWTLYPPSGTFESGLLSVRYVAPYITDNAASVYIYGSSGSIGYTVRNDGRAAAGNVLENTTTLTLRFNSPIDGTTTLTDLAAAITITSVDSEGTTVPPAKATLAVTDIEEVSAAREYTISYPVGPANVGADGSAVVTVAITLTNVTGTATTTVYYK